MDPSLRLWAGFGPAFKRQGGLKQRPILLKGVVQRKKHCSHLIRCVAKRLWWQINPSEITISMNFDFMRSIKCKVIEIHIQQSLAITLHSCTTIPVTHLSNYQYAQTLVTSICIRWEIANMYDIRIDSRWRLATWTFWKFLTMNDFTFDIFHLIVSCKN